MVESLEHRVTTVENDVRELRGTMRTEFREFREDIAAFKKEMRDRFDKLDAVHHQLLDKTSDKEVTAEGRIAKLEESNTWLKKIVYGSTATATGAIGGHVANILGAF